jgi:hypothetical protein
MLQCFSAIAKSQVDAETGVIRRVAVLTEGEAKGHPVKIDATTLAQVKQQAETFTDGVRVKMNHGTGVESIAGVLRNFTIDQLPEKSMGDANGQLSCLRADLHLLKTGESYAKLIEMAQTIPGAFGLSISFNNTPEKIGETSFARCSELYSADLVDSPAANPSGLFSVPKVDSQPFSKTMLTELQAIWKLLGEKIMALVGKPEATELTAVKSDLTALSEKIATELTAALSAKTDLETKLNAANTNLSVATEQITSIKTSLTAAASALKLDLKADASPVDTVTALQSAVTTTLAKLSVPAGNIPAPKPGDKADKSAGGKTMSMTEFRALPAHQKSAFAKEVNAGAAKLVD